MPTLDSLPPELVAEVVEHIADPATLCLVARVCSSFRSPAQRYLFSSVDLLDSDRAAQFLASEARARYRTRHLGLQRAVGIPIGLQVIEQCKELEGLGVFYSKVHGGGYQWCASEHAAGESNAPLSSRNEG